MVDTHCHLDSPRFDTDRQAVLSRAWEAGLTGLVIPAVGPGDWEAVAALAGDDPRLAYGLGIHPQLLPELDPAEDDAQLERLEALLARGGAAAVGECGLDGPSAPGAPTERQVRVLERHLELARRFELPVLLHCFHAHPQLVEVFKRVPLPERGIVLHSYSGGPDLARFYADRGCHFSFAGPVTFAEARKPVASLRAIPLERLMLETDAPDQAPHPHRGQRSEPAYVAEVAAAMARTLGLDPSELAARTTQTARTFFRRAFGGESG